MRILISLLICWIWVSFPTKPIGAQEAAEIHETNDHRLLSVPTTSGSYKLLYYEICNYSDHRSAFHWKGPGFGVDARNQLPQKFCARKKIYEADARVVRPSEVVFQGGVSDKVLTWVPCRALPVGDGDSCGNDFAGKIYSWFTRLEMFTSGPDGQLVEVETISISMNKNREATGGTISVRSSAGVEHVLVAFPEASTDIDDLQKLLDSDDGVKLETFSYFKDVRKLSADLLGRDIPETSPVISVQNLKPGTGYDSTLHFQDVSRLGRLIAVLAEKRGKVVARTDLVFEQP